jgi:hypothetical protein
MPSGEEERKAGRQNLVCLVCQLPVFKLEDSYIREGLRRGNA